MTSGIHLKHTNLAKPHSGVYHRNELGFIGAPCSLIQDLCASLARALKPAISTAFLDAVHQASGQISSDFLVRITDRIDEWGIRISTQPHLSHVTEAADVLLINSNHFPSSRQVVIVHPEKKESLARKKDRLTNVCLILLAPGAEDIYSFLSPDVPVLHLENQTAVIDNLVQLLQERVPPLRGLVLAGGKSQRMGKDKAQISYHGKPQLTFAAELLNGVCPPVSLSMADSLELTGPYPIIPDTFLNLGPYGGILSAFRQEPGHAWLVIACDLPLLDKATLLALVEGRDPSKIATCFHNPTTNFPEPLLTIWEPRAYPVLLHFLSRGYSCPRKVLINNPVCQLDPPDPSHLMNVNTPEEYTKANQLLHGKD